MAGHEVPRVLLVEPNGSLRRAVAELLRLHGMHVAEATDGETALTAVRAWHPTVVVLELCLGASSAGVTVLDTVQELEPRLPVILHTAGLVPGDNPELGCRIPVRVVAKGVTSADDLLREITAAHRDRVAT